MEQFLCAAVGDTMSIYLRSLRINFQMVFTCAFDIVLTSFYSQRTVFHFIVLFDLLLIFTQKNIFEKYKDVTDLFFLKLAYFFCLTADHKPLKTLKFDNFKEISLKCTEDYLFACSE